jgi:hypothetical protein
MTGQLGLFGPVYAPAEAKDYGAPGPHNAEDLEAAGRQDIDAQTEEILAIEKDLERRPAPIDAEHRGGNAGRQGKCRTCRECYRWHSRRPLRGAYCPACGTKLEGTTYSNHWAWNEGVEPLTAVEAWAKFEKGRR